METALINDHAVILLILKLFMKIVTILIIALILIINYNNGNSLNK